MEPTLNEILNVPADPERATGTPAVVYDNRELLHNLNINAQSKAENDWRKYSTFLNNLNSTYKNLEDIASADVATGDRDQLKKQGVDIFKDIIKDPRNIYNPATQAKISSLRSNATESKLNRSFDFAHRQFVAQNPELNTPENQMKIDQYLKQPLGARDPYMLNMPTIFDINGLRSSLLTHPSVLTKDSTSNVTSQDAEGKDIPGTEFIRTTEKNKYNFDRFMNLWDQSLATQKDKYGHSIGGYAQQVYNQLPQAKKKYYDQNGGIQALWHDLGVNSFGSDKDISETVKTDLKDNPAFLRAQSLAETIRHNKAAEAIGWKNANKGDIDDIGSADTILKEVAEIIHKGEPTTSENYQGMGGSQDMFDVNDPTLLQKFGKIDKDGKITNVPDLVQYNPKSDKLDLVYFERNSLDPTSISVTKSGKRVVKETKSIDPRTYLKEKAKLAFPNKDIGKINTLVEQAYTKMGGSLKNVSDYYFGKKQEPEAQKGLSDYDSDTQLKIHAFMKSNKISDESKAIEILKQHKIL